MPNRMILLPARGTRPSENAQNNPSKYLTQNRRRISGVHLIEAMVFLSITCTFKIPVHSRNVWELSGSHNFFCDSEENLFVKNCRKAEEGTGAAKSFGSCGRAEGCRRITFFKTSNPIRKNPPMRAKKG